ncbi:MAG: DNA-protecting protein DprA, partial [Firmicutes bacterium]|nr:DNA-protecting protein DprA [Bacillota bacterium]
MDAVNVKYLLSLGQIPGMSQKSVTDLMDAFGDAETAWHSVADWEELLPLPRDKREALIRAKSEVDPDIVDAYREKLGVKVVSVLDDAFPDPLRNVEDPPYYLTYFGTLPDPEKLTISVIGTRKATDYGKAATEKIVSELVEKADVQIVNGMAEGIDGEALRATLRAGGHGTAFLGCGIDVVYPTFHRKLYEELKVKGCVASDYPFGYPSLRQNFPRRNRLMSGIAQGILVVEANRKSGTLHTVNHGLEQGKNIYAMPGSIFSSKSELPHYLIEMGHAKFVSSAEAILEDYL